MHMNESCHVFMEAAAEGNELGRDRAGILSQDTQHGERHPQGNWRELGNEDATHILTNQ